MFWRRLLLCLKMILMVSLDRIVGLVYLNLSYRGFFLEVIILYFSICKVVVILLYIMNIYGGDIDFFIEYC